jgi:hypothetical protein
MRRKSETESDRNPKSPRAATPEGRGARREF